MIEAFCIGSMITIGSLILIILWEVWNDKN